MNKWISIKDELPEEGSFILIYYEKHKHITLAEYFKNIKDNKVLLCLGNDPPGPYIGDLEINEISHWMPLPEPPND